MGPFYGNGYHVVLGADNALLDGFTITKGNANGDVTLDTSGAGIQCIDTSPTIRNCLITENTALYGGGMHNFNSSATVIDCVFSKNVAHETGGSIYNEKCTGLSFTNCEFIGNIDEGGVSVPSNSTVTITTVVPTWHWDTTYGQGEEYLVLDPEIPEEIRWGWPECTPRDVYKSGMRFTSAVFSEPIPVNNDFPLGTLCHLNYTTGSGTAIEKARLTVTLDINGAGEDPDFSFFLDINETDNGVYNSLCGYEDDIDCCNDIITFPSKYPSAMFNIDGREYTLEILGFKDDSGILYEEFDSLEWSDCDDNTKTLWARITPPPTRGAVKNVASTVDFENCSFVGNTAEHAMGGALANWGCESVGLSNCTIIGNHGNFCGGIYNHESNVYIANTILWGNTDSDSSTSLEQKQLYNVSVDPEDVRNCTVTYGCIQDDNSVNNDYVGDNIIYEKPVLMSDPYDGGDGWGNANDDYGNVRLSEGSLCIDAGNNSEVSSGLVKDLDGRPRFVDDPDTDDAVAGAWPEVDIGAYAIFTMT